MLQEEIFRRIVALGSNIEGITISGGEPLQQLSSVTGLLRRIREDTGLSVILFTGYSWEEVQHVQNPQLASEGNPPREIENNSVNSVEVYKNFGTLDLSSSTLSRGEGVRFSAGTFARNDTMTSDLKGRWNRTPEVLEYVDVLFTGRYRADQRVGNGLLGASGKSVHFLTNRYCAEDLERVPSAEVILSSSGEISISGIEPLLWKSY